MQQEILDLLEKEGKPLGRIEIAFKLNCRPEHVTSRLTLLLKYKEIKCIEIDRIEAKKRFNAKRRMRLYYI